VESFQQYCVALERLTREGRQLLQPQSTSGTRQPPAALGSMRRGATPAPSECQEELENLWRMCKHEVALKTALLPLVQWDSTEAELAQIQVSACDVHVTRVLLLRCDAAL
jgi:hypothetical protein